MTGQTVGFMNPTTLSEALECAEMIAKSSMIPSNYRGKAGDVLIAGQMGAELGVPWLQALQGICVINGNPSVWGDLALALVRNHPKFEDMNETYDEDTRTATCTIKIKDQMTPVTQSFSWADACQAQLSTKDTYKKYRRRMLQMRARSWCMRDAIPEALKGLKLAEDQQALAEAYIKPIDAETGADAAPAEGMAALSHKMSATGPKAENEHPEGSAEWWAAVIKDAGSSAQLEKVGFELRAADPELRDDLRGLYEQRVELLKNSPFIEGELVDKDTGEVLVETDVPGEMVDCKINSNTDETAIQKKLAENEHAEPA